MNVIPLKVTKMSNNDDNALVIFQKHDNIALLLLNRHEALNALNQELIDCLAEYLKTCEDDDTISIIMISSKGKSFIAGADIKAMAVMDYPQNYIDNFMGDAWHYISKCRKPIIAAVNGYALGGGCEFAMMCDIIYASENATFSQPEITLGTLPGIGGTQRMAKAIGKAKTMDMILSGRRMDANEAEKSGLISQILPNDNFINHALNAARDIAQYSLPALMMAKESINYAFNSRLNDGLTMERQLFLSSFALEDRKEGMRAFIEKRKPNFKNK